METFETVLFCPEKKVMFERFETLWWNDFPTIFTTFFFTLFGYTFRHQDVLIPSHAILGSCRMTCTHNTTYLYYILLTLIYSCYTCLTRNHFDSVASSIFIPWWQKLFVIYILYWSNTIPFFFLCCVCHVVMSKIIIRTPMNPFLLC